MTHDAIDPTPAEPIDAGGWQLVAAYQWPEIDVPSLDDDWTPTRSVSVVIPAYDCQEKLDLTLAALAAQRYPESLLEVVVSDDGSTPPLHIPEQSPANTRIVVSDRSEGGGAGRARHAGAQAAEGEILVFLDADMVVFPDHVRAHARWHHVVREAVTLGHKRFVDFAGVTASAVASAAQADQLFELLADRPHQAHEWIEEMTARLDNLTTYQAEMFTAAVTATIGMRADLYREAGGFRTSLRAGEDMEFGYRLMTAGAVFIPEPRARSWHQGEATYMSKAEEVRRRNNPNFANYVPVPGRFRPWTPGRQYAVPMVGAVLETRGDQTFEFTKTVIDSVLGSEETDLRIEVCGLEDSSEFPLILDTYRDDPRVGFRKDTPETAFPAQYTLFLPEWVLVKPPALGELLDRMELEHLGVLQVVVPGVPPSDGMVVLWRTAALHRARRALAGGSGDVLAMAGRLFGERWVDGAEVGILDLRVAEEAEIEEPPKRRPPVSVTVEKLHKAKANLKEARAEAKQLRKDLKSLEQRHDRLKERYRRLRARLPVRVLVKLSSLVRRGASPR